jgi:hypothetical protein
LPFLNSYIAFREKLCKSFFREIFIYFNQLFLFERKSCKKRQKSLQDLSALSVQVKAQSARLSPLVMFARPLQTFGGTARRKDCLQIFHGLQTRYRRELLLKMGAHRFAEGEKFVYCENAPWFRVNFTAKP